MSSTPKSSFEFKRADDDGTQPGWKDGYAEELRYTFSTECDDFNGDAGACFRLGEWHSVVNNDRKKSLEIYLRNCKSNNHGFLSCSYESIKKMYLYICKESIK